VLRPQSASVQVAVLRTLLDALWIRLMLPFPIVVGIIEDWRNSFTSRWPSMVGPFGFAMCSSGIHLPHIGAVVLQSCAAMKHALD
jgi:hypothetical protein